MYLNIVTIIFLIFENLSKVYAQGVPVTPCPKIFQYRFNGSEWFGILSVRNPELGQPLNLRVTLSMRGKPATNYFGEIQLLTRGKFFSDEPVFYKIKFPKSHLPPKLLQITVNNQVVCLGMADLTVFVTQIQLEHTRKFTFLPHEVSTPIQPTSSSPFLPAIDAMGLDGGHLATETKGISTPLQPATTALDAKHLLFINKEKSPTHHLKESCGTIDGRISFNVLQALKQSRNPGTNSTDTLLSAKSTGALQTAEGKKGGEIKRPLIISNISDDSGESDSKQPTITRGAWPWLTAVYVNNLTSLVYQCSGTLVSSRVIISAAHCFQLFNQHYTANEVLVFLGRHNLINWSEEGSLAAPVDDIFIHPNFNKNLNSYDADIAVLILKTEVRLSSFIRPACLWSGPTEPEYLQGEQGVVVGWSPGSQHFSTFNTVPKILSAPIVSNSVCFHANPKYESLSSNRTFCAGVMWQQQDKMVTASNSRDKQLTSQQPTYHGPCTGDSGAGLMIFKNNRWMLRGLVSGLLPLQSDLTSSPTCSTNQFVIYTDVAQFLDWILAFVI